MVITRSLGVFALAGMALLSACAPAASPTPASLADDETKAVYNVDIAGTTAHMDDSAKSQVTAQSVGFISDHMHALGAYKGLTQTNADPDKGRYVFQAAFDRGTLVVDVRLDADGKIGAYRVAPATE